MGAVEEMSCGWLLQRGISSDGCDLASTLCRYVLRRVRRGSILTPIRISRVILRGNQWPI